MVLKFDAKGKKWIALLTFLLNSVCLTYTFATRFSDILYAPKTEKLILFTGYFTITVIISALIYLVWFRTILRRMTGKTFFLVLIASLLFMVFLFATFYSLPPFPENHF